MTNPNLAYIQIIIDRSGSMQPLRQTVVSGLNDFLAGQRKLPGVCHVGLCWFGGVVDHVFDNKPLTDVKDFNIEDYVPNGGTPLYEAMCTSIDALGTRLAALPEDKRPGLVTVLTITDGEENSSQPGFTAERIKHKVETQTKQYNWNFQYLGANQDAVLAAKTLGISAFNSATFTVNNMQATYAVMGASITRGRTASLRGLTPEQQTSAMCYSTNEVSALTAESPATP